MEPDAFGNWTARFFAAGVGLFDLLALGWEVFIRHGLDAFLVPMLIFIMVVPLLGPSAAKYLQRKG